MKSKSETYIKLVPRSLAENAKRYYNELPPHAKERKGGFYIKEILIENEKLRIALADAIRRPIGVIPGSADVFIGANELAEAAKREDGNV